MNTLALFISPADRERSALAVPGRSHIPDLLVQGVVGKRIADDSIIQSVWPTTLVDLNQGTVTQTYPFHEYKVLRREYQKLLIQKLLKSASKSNLWEAQESVFQPVKGSIAPCVKRIVQETMHLPPYLRVGFVTASVRALFARCYVLIKYVETFSRQQQLRQQRERRRAQQQQHTAQPDSGPASATATEGSHVHAGTGNSTHASTNSSNSSTSTNNSVPPNAAGASSAASASAVAQPRDAHATTSPGDATAAMAGMAGATAASTAPTLPPSMQYSVELSANPAVIKRIRQDLDLTEPCYYVMLGLAELIKPGIFRALAGDPASQELRWIELFESF